MDRRCCSASRDWAKGLPEETYGSILECLTIVDHIRFGAVCVYWHSVVKCGRYHPVPQLPWILLQPEQIHYSSDDGDDDVDDTGNDINVHNFELLCLSDSGETHQTYHPLPSLHSTRCVGSSLDGLWLVFYDMKDLYLLNPITKIRADLPSLAIFPEGADEVHVKVAMSTSSTGRISDFIMAAIHIRYYLDPDEACCILAFARGTNETWRVLEIEPYDYISDFTYHDGKLYVVGAKGNIMLAYDILREKPSVLPTMLSTPREGSDGGLSRLLLLPSSGSLLLVREKIRAGAWWFDIFKLELDVSDDGNAEWVELKSLDDRVLFLAHDDSICIRSQDLPEGRRNCIYFLVKEYATWRYHWELHVLSLEDRGETFYSFTTEIVGHVPRTIWYAPNLGETILGVSTCLLKQG